MKDQQIEKAMDGIENRIRHIYNCGYQQGYEDGKKNHEKVRNDDMGYGYQRGLEDAWECARKITGGEYDTALSEIFGNMEDYQIIRHFTAYKAMNKINDYEERQTDNGKTEKPCDICVHNKYGICVQPEGSNPCRNYSLWEMRKEIHE